MSIPVKKARALCAVLVTAGAVVALAACAAPSSTTPTAGGDRQSGGVLRVGVNDDATVWTLTLKPGMTFQDGRVAKAEDLAETLRRTVDAAGGVPASVAQIASAQGEQVLVSESGSALEIVR